jgi:KDO2-lipid IV(A) lauroyltransferase
MSISLSKLLQLRCNVFLYKRLSWEVISLYIIILGKLYFFFNRKEKRKIEEAVEKVFQGNRFKFEMKAIKRNVFQGIISHYYEKLYNAYEKIEGLKVFFEESIEIHSLNKLDNALRDGKGVLFVTGHYGGIEYIPIFLALHKYPISVIARFATNDLKNKLYSKTNPLGLKIIDANQRNGVLMSIIQELKENRIVFIECDEIEEWKPSQKEKIFFLGKMMGVDKTINVIQKRTGTKVIFGILHRFNLRQYSLVIESYQDILLQIGRNTSSVGEAVLKSFEQYIYSYPEEWYQWKNFTEIETVSTPSMQTKEVVPSSLLQPFFARVS